VSGLAGHRSLFSLRVGRSRAMAPGAPDGDRSPSNRTAGVGTKEPSRHGIGTRKRRGDGETRIPVDRMVATRQWFATRSGRVARE